MVTKPTRLQCYTVECMIIGGFSFSPFLEFLSLPLILTEGGCGGVKV